MKNKIVTKVVDEIVINQKDSIHVGRVVRSDVSTPIVDIRKFRLYSNENGVNDGVKRHTNKGIGISLSQLPELLNALSLIYECEFGVPYTHLENQIGTEEFLKRKAEYLKIMNEEGDL